MMNYKESFSEFESDRILYKAITVSDAALLVKWRSDLEIIKYFQNPTPPTNKSHTQWFNDNYLQNSNRVDYILYEKKTRNPIGTCNISIVNDKCQSAYVGYAIGESSYQGKGFASEALRSLMNFYLCNANIHHFIAEIHKDNIASIKLVLKLGYSPVEQNDDFHIYRLDKD